MHGSIAFVPWCMNACLSAWVRIVCMCIWVGSRSCGCLVTWFCYHLIARPVAGQPQFRDLTHMRVAYVNMCMYLLYVLPPLFILYISLLLFNNNHLYVLSENHDLFTLFYVYVFMYVWFYVLILSFVTMNLSNQIVPIYLLSNKVDLFYKKYAFISS